MIVLSPAFYLLHVATLWRELPSSRELGNVRLPGFKVMSTRVKEGNLLVSKQLVLSYFQSTTRILTKEQSNQQQTPPPHRHSKLFRRNKKNCKDRLKTRQVPGTPEREGQRTLFVE